MSNEFLAHHSDDSLLGELKLPPKKVSDLKLDTCNANDCISAKKNVCLASPRRRVSLSMATIKHLFSPNIKPDRRFQSNGWVSGKRESLLRLQNTEISEGYNL